MKIVAFVKQVPDTAAKVVAENGQISWGNAELVLNPWDEYAVEAALQLKEAQGGTVTVVSMGAESASESLKTALAMGCNNAILISDAALAGADSLATAKVLAAAIQHIGDVSVAVFGRQAIDGDNGVTAAQTARVLGWPVLSLTATIDSVDNETVRVSRAIEEGRQVVEGHLPAVLSIAKDFGEPRYPSFMGIRKAARATIPTWNLSELGISAPASAVTWPDVNNPENREISCEFIGGDSPEQIAGALADKLIAEKVL